MRRSIRYLASSFLLGLISLYGQNTISLNPNTVFLNAGLNAGPATATVNVTSNPGVVGITVAAPTVPWLTVTQATPNTPTTLTFTGNPAGLAAGVYNTTAAITTPSGTVSIPVVMTINSPSPLTAAPTSLVFNFTQGAAAPAAQNISISSSSPAAYNVTGTAKWLLFSTSGQSAPGAPGSVSVAVDPTQVPGPGTYIASITVTPTNGLPSITLPVVLYVLASPQLSATPSALSFNFQVGGTSNVLQKTISLTSSSTPLTFTASATTNLPGIQWLSIANTQGNTPGTVTVSISPFAFPLGQYQGTITINSPGASNPTTTIPVTLNISDKPLLDLSPSTLQFSYQAGGPVPPDQFVTPASTTPAQNYTVAVSTNGTGNWLTATAPGLTPQPVDVAVNPVGMPAGNYTGTLTFNMIGGSNNPQVVTVNLTVTNNPTLITSPTATTGLVFNFETGLNTPAPQTVSVSSSGADLPFSVTSNQSNTSNGVNWLLLGTPSGQTTPATFTVGVNPAGMNPGQYSGNVTVAAPGGTSQVTLPITLNITAAGTALLSVSPSSITFTSVNGSVIDPLSVTVSSTGETVQFQAVPNIISPAGGTWLIVGPPSGPTSSQFPSRFTVVANAQGLAPGTYRANISIQPTNGTPNVILPVTLVVSAGNIAAAPATLTFTQAAGSPPPPTQTINLTSNGVPLAFNVFASGAQWLGVTPPNGTTPATLTVNVNGGSLQPGNYTGQINIVAPGAGNSPQAVTVNLTVTAAQTLALSAGGASSLTFTSQAGAAAPPTQTIGVTVSAGSAPFTAAASVTSPAGGNWLSVTPTSGTASTTASNLTVSVNPQGLAAGTYTGTVTVTSPTTGNSPQRINVTYTVTAIPTPAPTAIANAGSFQPGAVAPGEIVTIGGTNMGPPAPGVVATITGNSLPTQVSDTQVTFDNIPAPLLYVSDKQINTIVPYGVTGRAQTRIVVTYKGTASTAIVQNVADTAPGIFPSGAPGVPQNQAAVLNANGSFNGPNNPAPKGQPIVIYATGEGQTNPPGVDGLIIPLDVNALKKPILPVLVTIGGQPAEVQYAGSAPGFVSGALQINAVVPDTAPSGSAVPISFSVGGNSSSNNFTVAIQ